jgi:hypothetical protein
MTAPRGIHYRRRWFYVLWVGLLLLSAGALALWERPQAVDLASLVVQVQVRQAPPGTQVQAWAGPWARWQGPLWSGAGAASTTLLADGLTPLPLITIPIAQRRWVKGTIPRDTWELVMLRFAAPLEPPRYFALPLSKDIRTGLLRPRGKVLTTIQTSWLSLQTSGKAPDRIP